MLIGFGDHTETSRESEDVRTEKKKIVVCLFFYFSKN